ncbi:MAG: hypothetical protein ACRCXC_01400 [Legionella sp.]
MPSENPVVYNQATVLSWQDELPTIQLKIDENLRLIQEQKVRLGPYQRQ